MKASATRRLIGVIVGVSVLFGATNALAAIRITKIVYNPHGRDAVNLDEEVVFIKNRGDYPVSMSNWVIQDRSGHDLSFGQFHLNAGQVVRVHSGTAYENSLHDVYWHSQFPIWNNQGDTAILTDGNGNHRDRCRYSGGDRFAIC